MRRGALLFVAVLNILFIFILLKSLPAYGREKQPAGSLDTGFFNEYPIPFANGSPLNIIIETTGPPTRVWFTMPDANAIGNLVVTDTTDFTFDSVTIPTSNSKPYDLAYDGAATIWFTEQNGNKIGRLNLTTRNITEYPIPTANSRPSGIAVAPNGYIWFLERDGNKLGQFNPIIEQFIAEYEYDRVNGQLEDIAIRNNSSIWFTSLTYNLVSEYRLNDNNFIDVPVIFKPGSSTTLPGDIIFGSDLLWVSAPNEDWSGVHFPGTVTFWRSVSMLVSGGGPTGLAFSSPDGLFHIWFAETAAGRVGKFVSDTQGEISYHWTQTLPSANSQPRNLVIAENEHAWITEMGANKIAEWHPPTEFYMIYLPQTLKH